MQPYLFPYIGYFQLISSVDKFVVYDDVTYIKQGWINRNSILIDGKKSTFTVPLVGASSNKLIHQIPVGNIEYWSKSFYKTLEYNYRKAPFYEQTISIIEKSLSGIHDNISELNSSILKVILNYLDINTCFVDSSRVYKNQGLSSQERIIDICLKEEATQYINAIGGRALYSHETFRDNRIDLSFIASKTFEYHQFNHEFVPYLSIIDVLMFNSAAEVNGFLQSYDLV